MIRANAFLCTALPGTVLGIVICVLAAGSFTKNSSAAQGKALSSAELEKIAARAMDSPAADRGKLIEQLETAAPLTAASVKTWTKKLTTQLQKGPKLPDKARNYLYDEKAKKGLYLMGGKSGANMLFFGLHGGGVGSGDAETAKSPWNGAVSGAGWAAVFPEVLEKTEAAWGDENTELFVLELIEGMKNTYKIDTNRIYLGGHSMGGYGTWTIGGRHADLFAGLMAFAGAATPYRNKNNSKQIEGIQVGILPNLRNVPIYVFHSKDDPRVDFETNEFAVAALGKLQKEHGGYLHHFDAVDGRGHAFPDPKPAIEFVQKKPRDPRPKTFLWQPFRKWKRMFYWLWWDNPDPAAIVKAEIKSRTEIQLSITGPKDPPSGLSVLLDERLVDMDKEIVIVVNGQEKFRGVPLRSLAVMVQTAAERRDPEMIFSARVKL